MQRVFLKNIFMGVKKKSSGVEQLTNEVTANSDYSHASTEMKPKYQIKKLVQ